MRRATIHTLQTAALLLSTSHLFAQTGSLRVSLPSPTAASLGKFGDIPVSLYTGTPDISIPLFVAKGKTLELPIVLRYHAGGIRVQEVGSWVGIGWTLEAGGAITRTVRGLADESLNGYYNTGHTFYNSGNWPTPTPTIIDNIMSEQLDGEPDQFFFSFAGRSGQFVVGPASSSSAIKDYRTIPHQKLRIEPTPGFGSWVITTEDGTRYTFAAAETNTDYNLTSPGSEMPAHYGPPGYTSSWQLTEIRSAGGDVITFYYGTYTPRHRLPTYVETFADVVSEPGSSCPNSPFEVTNEYEVVVQKLDSIKTAAHTVKFAADTLLRTDALSPTGQQQERRLDQITVMTPSGTVLRAFRFGHGYSTGRLTLNNVVEVDAAGDSLPSYAFTYNGPTLPSLTSYSVDHWGYYNGKNNSTYIPPAVTPSGIPLAGADRSPDVTYLRAGVLSRITYPTGGYHQFLFEANDYGKIGTGLIPKAESDPLSAQAVADNFDGLVTTPFTVGGTESVNATVSVSLSPACEQFDCPWVDIQGVSTWHTPGTYSVLLAPGQYALRASDEFTAGYASIRVDWRDISLVKKKTAGGLRLAELQTADAMGSITVRKYKYTVADDTSSGVVNAEPAYTHQYTSSACSYFSRSSTSKMPLGGGPVVGYREVTVWHGATAEHGTTHHKFLSVLDAIDPPPTWGIWPHAPRTSYEWMRGRELQVTEYTAGGAPQQRTASTYTYADMGENVVLYSEQFENAVWTATNTTVSVNATVAPSGTQTADKLVENTALGFHGRYQPFTYVPSTVVFASVSMKAAGRTKGQLLVGSGNANFQATFDLIAGTVTASSSSSNANGTGVLLGAEIVSEGSGWYRLRLKGYVSGTITTLFFATYAGEGSYQGDGASGVYVWGASVSKRSWTYVSTTGLTGIGQGFRALSVHAFSAGQYGSAEYYNDYLVLSAWAYQSAETATFYDTTGTASFSTTKSYVYGNPSHLQVTEITETNSDNSQRITRMKYPGDYAVGSTNPEATALTAMRDTYHVHNPVIERWVIKRVGATDSVMQAEVTSFKKYAAGPPGQYLPYQRFLLNSPTGVTNFVPSAVTTGSFAIDSRYLLHETANTYDATGRVTQIADARSNVTNYEYGGNINNAFLKKVTRVKDGLGDLVTEVNYDPAVEYVTSIKDEAGTFRRFSYDTHGRLTQIKNHNSVLVTEFAYAYSRTSANGWMFQTGTPNAVTTTTHVQQSPPKSIPSTQYLDGLGRPIQTVDFEFASSYLVTATQYDQMGRPWRTWKPYRQTTAVYDQWFATNAVSFYNSYLGRSTAVPYVETLYRPDALGRVKQVTPEYDEWIPATPIVHGYDVNASALHQITQITDEAGKKRRTFTDVFGNHVKTILGSTAPESTVTQLFYNALGQRTKAADPRNLNTTYALDTRGLLTSKTSPDAGTINHKYDKGGNLRFSQDANQLAANPDLVSFTTYDFANRPLVSGQAAATFASLNPDAAEAFESANTNWLVVRQYDAEPPNVFPWNQFWTQIDPLSLQNVGGRLAAVASKSNGAWQVTLFSYDVEGQVATRYTFTQANGGGSVLTALNTSVTYTRDLRGALTQRQLMVGSSPFNHWYDYNGRGLLSKVFATTSTQKPASPDVTYNYHPWGQLNDRLFAGGTTVHLTYDIRSRLTKIGDPATTDHPFSARYSYDLNGTVSLGEFYSGGAPVAEKRYKYVFTYDALQRLKTANYSGWNGTGWTSTLAHDLANLSYDVAGNIKSLRRYRQDATLIDRLGYFYPGTSNQLTSVSDTAGVTGEAWDAETGAFTYDANGNLNTAPGPYAITAVTYDHQNLALSLTSNGTTTVYRYNEAGQRITKQVGAGNTEVYVLDGATSLGVFTVNGAGSPTSWFFNVLATDKVMGRQPNVGDRRHYHTDLLGSTRAVTDSGVILESYDFEPWGLLMPGRTLGSGTKEGFTSKEQDAETGLDYFGARYYMPALGRWAAADPLAEKHPEWSPYNYVLDNPLSLIDPDGRQVAANPGILVPILGGGARGAVAGSTAGPVGVVVGTAVGIAVTVAVLTEDAPPGRAGTVEQVADATSVSSGTKFTTETATAIPVATVLHTAAEEAGGAKGREEYDRHVKGVEAARERLKGLKEDVKEAKGPKAQRPIRKEIEKLQKEIKGHEKEIRQKWPDGPPQS